MMNSIYFVHIIPLIITAATAVLVMIQAAVYRSRLLPAALTVTGLAAGLGSVIWMDPPTASSALFVHDSFGYFFQGLILLGALLIAGISPAVFRRLEMQQEEYYILLLLSTLGTQVLVISDHFIALFVGLELLSLGLFALIGYMTDQKRSLEASMKYLLMASASSAFLLFGMALLYGLTGSMSFGEIGTVIEDQGNTLYLSGGLALILVGAGFKLALTPFHLWAPDVYQGARSPVTAFIATASKAAVFAVFFRFFLALELFDVRAIYVVLAVLAIGSMVGGNVLALLEKNVKRILAYSSIAHLGYLLVAFIAGSFSGIASASFYFFAYFLTIIGAFGVVLYFDEGEELAAYRGLFWKQPWMAGIFTVILLSLAGIPLTAGFFGKYYVLLAGVEENLWLLVIVLVLSSVIGLFYYLRIVVTMISQTVNEAKRTESQPAYLYGVLAIVAVLIIAFGVYPTPAIEVIRESVQSLF